jgi:integrase
VAEQYVAFLQARGLARSTVMTNRNMLNHAQRAWGDIEVADIHPRHVDQLFIGKDWSQGTKNIYLIALRNFLKYCRTHGYLPADYDPTTGWRTQTLEKREKTWLRLPALGALLDAAEHARDRAFIALGIYTFMRASEIVALRWQDVDLTRNEIHIYRVKTKQADQLPICAELRYELAAWLVYVRNEMGEIKPDWYVVPSIGPRPMKGVNGQRRLEPTGGPNPLRPDRPIGRPQRIVKNAMERIGVVNKGDGCHVLRRSGARSLFEQLRETGYDGSARRVQSMLGHASVITTEIYLGIDNERRQRNEMLAGHVMFPGDTNPSANLQLPAPRAQLEGTKETAWLDEDQRPRLNDPEPTTPPGARPSSPA